jgi:hypothetical protein
MFARKLYWVAAAFVVVAVFAVAQQAQQPAEKSESDHTYRSRRPTPLLARSVQQLLRSLSRRSAEMAAASALKATPTDPPRSLKGKYPALHVTSVIRGEAELPTHGNKEMPVWGPLFFRLSQGHESEVQQRIANLNQYIESMQKK